MTETGEGTGDFPSTNISLNADIDATKMIGFNTEMGFLDHSGTIGSTYSPAIFPIAGSHGEISSNGATRVGAQVGYDPHLSGTINVTYEEGCFADKFYEITHPFEAQEYDRLNYETYLARQARDNYNNSKNKPTMSFGELSAKYPPGKPPSKSK